MKNTIAQPMTIPAIAASDSAAPIIVYVSKRKKINR